MPDSSRPTSPGRLAVLFAIPVLFSMLFFVLNMKAERDHVRLVRLQSLNSGIGKLRSFANDAEVAVNGFLITGNDSYLGTLDSVNQRMNRFIASVSSGSGAGETDTRDRLAEVIMLVRQRVAEANRLVELEHRDGFKAAFDEAKQGKSLRTMQRIRSIVDDLQVELSAKVSQGLERERTFTQRSFLIFLFGTLVMLVVLIWLYQSLLDYIASRNRAHAELEALNLDLEKRIAERTKELQDFNEELQQFAYVASHDLQEPLRTIISFTQLLQARYQERFDDEANEFMGYVTTSARRMSELINGLLAVVRLRKSGQPLTPIAFSELLEEAKIGLAGSIRESGAQISGSNLPVLRVDRLQFAQVFQNLIGNAIKYRRNEPPVIQIAGKQERDQWVLSFADNGRGFNQDFAERIFGMFQRLLPREVEGTGMGLFITKRIVDRHGGRIWADSTESVGSTFYIALPVSLEVRSEEQEVNAEAAISR